MNLSKSVLSTVTMMLICITQAGAEDIHPLQPRDLDGDPDTIEAYYYLPADTTWLASTNIGRSETFGLIRAGETGVVDPFQNGVEINLEGRMRSSSVRRYLEGMNNNRYFGHSDWRLPTFNTECVSSDINDESTEGCLGGEVGTLKRMLSTYYNGIQNAPFVNFSSSWSHWVTADAGYRDSIYSFSGDDSIEYCIRCGYNYVWPVHDGDIGIGPHQCIDTDGDGWGWNGLSSCVATSINNTQCKDTAPLGNGWGWNGTESCRIPEHKPECIDTAPEGDGWGWDGETSCEVFQVPDVYRCDDIGNYPWGWNPTVSSTCSLALKETPDFPTNEGGFPEFPEVPVSEMIDVPLICKRLIDRYYCNCDNSITDSLADPQEYDEVFFTATLRQLSQTEVVGDSSYSTLNIEGTWQDRWYNEIPAYRTDEENTLNYAPSPGQSFRFSGFLTYYSNGQGDVFMKQSNYLVGGNDVEALSHCVVR